MFSLVITIIALALVAALAAAAIYYGGPALHLYQDRAHATQLLNEGAQVRGAAELYRSEKGNSAQNLADLIDNKYLKSGITSSKWASVIDGYAQRTTSVPDSECILANKSLGIEGIPSCDDPKYARQIVCCKQSQSTPSAPIQSVETLPITGMFAN